MSVGWQGGVWTRQRTHQLSEPQELRSLTETRGDRADVLKFKNIILMLGSETQACCEKSCASKGQASIHYSCMLVLLR